jgi:hypothetical protein
MERIIIQPLRFPSLGIIKMRVIQTVCQPAKTAYKSLYEPKNSGEKNCSRRLMEYWQVLDRNLGSKHQGNLSHKRENLSPAHMTRACG